jgi:predicted TIM-barrel fold metal-dependent hydrolase
MTQVRTTAEGKPEKVYINRKFYDQDFSSKDLTHADFRGCTLVNCNFDNSDLRYATFEGANCYKSSFRQSRLYKTNFKDAILSETDMDPRDMFGMTVSVSCDTVDKMKLGTIWLASWLFLPLLADIPDKTKEDIRGVLHNLIGEERVKQMERLFAERQI